MDDEPALLLALKIRLRQEGFRIATAPSGKEALAVVAESDFDLILLDINMPGMDGFETCSHLQNDPKTAYIPVIFLTASSTDHDRSRAFALGAVDYVVKPFDRADLVEKIRFHIRSKTLWEGLSRDATPSKEKAQTGSFTEFKKSLAIQLDLSAGDRSRLSKATPAGLYELATRLKITPTRMAKQIAEFLNIDYVSFVNPLAINLGELPTAFCKANQLVVTRTGSEKHKLIMTNPFDGELRQTVEMVIGSASKYTLAATEPENILSLFEPNELTSMADIEEEVRKSYSEQEVVHFKEATSEESAPMIMLVNKIIVNAYEMGASDIHIEPAEREVVVRCRVDGELRIVQRIEPQSLIRPITARIKIMSDLDISERRLPQDGRIAFKKFSDGRRDFSLRVATSPSHFGEKVVLRILDEKRSLLPLDQLGFSPRGIEAYRDRIRAPYGMILHVGPTGSGKSLALYAALNEIKNPGINIQTAEDPIEYTLDGITQLQIHADIGLTFKRALRSFLRQDPDVILVGEIRDRETADVALEAALTGHLVLSTLHTNDAASTIMRFVEMGIEPFMISSSIILVCAQRLVRRLCTACRVAYEPAAEEREMIGATPDEALTLYRAGRCDECDGTG